MGFLKAIPRAACNGDGNALHYGVAAGINGDFISVMFVTNDVGEMLFRTEQPATNRRAGIQFCLERFDIWLAERKHRVRRVTTRQT